jgi:hypothetical protein
VPTGDAQVADLREQLRRFALLRIVERREDAGDGDRARAVGDRLAEPQDLVRIERQAAAVDLDAAVRHEHRTGARLGEIGGPSGQGRHRGRAGRAEPEHGDLQQPASLHDRIRRVGRAERDARDLAGVRDGRQRPRDALDRI